MRTQEGIGEASGGVAVVSAARISWLTGWRTPAARRVTIGWKCPGSRWMATEWYTGGSVRFGGSSGAKEGLVRGGGR
jgi:transcription elongation factor